MTKSETREVQVITRYYAAGLELDWVARSLSSLIRSARTTKSRNELITYAAGFPSLVQHPEFIIG